MNAPAYDLSRYANVGSLLYVAEDTSPGYSSPGEEPGQEKVDWKQVDERICELGVERAGHEHEVCRWLVLAEELEVPSRLGFASLKEYAARRLGLNGRKTKERLRVGKALVELPLLDEALSTGALMWSVVRELTRKATPDTEQAWKDWAEDKSPREVEKGVAYRQRGDLPTDPPDPTLAKHVIRFEVRAETMAVFQDLQADIRVELGGDAEDDLVLYEIVRRALGGEGDGGRAPYQVAVTRCDTCAQVAIDGGGESYPVDAVVQNVIACDAQHIGSVSPHVGPELDEESEAGTHMGQAPAPERITNSPRSLQRGCSPARAASRDVMRQGNRATQTVPPATRRGVIRRKRCCAAPGCRNSRHLQVHHVVPRSEGGDHNPLLLVPLCHRHHSQMHDGTLVVTGDAKGGFIFRHADGTGYGKPLQPAAVDIAKQAFDALRALGFKLTQARELIDAVQRDGAPDSLEEFMRAALRAT